MPVRVRTVARLAGLALVTLMPGFGGGVDEPSDETTTTGARGIAAAMAAMLFGLAVVAGCGDDAAGDEDAGKSTTTESTTAESTMTTEPPATDAAAVRPVIEDLLSHYDEVLGEVLVEPAHAQDPDAPLHEELEALFTREELEARLATFSKNADDRAVYEPLGVEPIRDTELWGEITPDGDDALEALICTTYNYRYTGPEGGEVKDGLSHPGIMYAARVDGVWKIARIDEDSSQVCDASEDLS